MPLEVSEKMCSSKIVQSNPWNKFNLSSRLNINFVSVVTRDTQLNLRRRCGLFPSFSTWECGTHSAVLSLSCSLWRAIFSTLKWKMPLTSTSKTEALFWLSHDKSRSPSKLLLRLFKFSIIAQLSAARQKVGYVHSDLRNPSSSGLWLMVPSVRWLFLYFYLLPCVVEAQPE